MHKFLFYNKYIIFLYMFRAHVLIIRRSKFYYTASGIITLCRWPSRAQHYILYCIILYYIILYYIILRCISLCYIALHYIILYYYNITVTLL